MVSPHANSPAMRDRTGFMRYAWHLSTLAFLVGAVSCGSELLFLVKQNQVVDASLAGRFLLIWSLAAISIVLAGACWDLSRRPLRWQAIIAFKADLIISTLVFVGAATVRSFGPLTGALDEMMVFREVITLQQNGSVAITSMSMTSYPYFIHWAVFFLNKAMHGVVDTFILIKVLSIFSASLSIAIWYWVVRLYSARHVALAAASLLTFWGWHYVNSRFIYLYPHDLLAISVGVLSCVLAFRNRMASAAAMLGIVLAYSLIVRKISIMLFPLGAYFYLDCYIISKKTDRWKLLVLPAVVLVALCLAFASWVVVINVSNFDPSTWNSGSPFFRYNDALQIREKSTAGVAGQFGNIFYLFQDGLRQLFFESYDVFRHYFKPRGALLDPAFTAFFALGLGYALVQFRTQQIGRLAIVGLLIFMLPMVLSYPLDSESSHGLARRMVGISCFAALIAALGIDRIATWIFPIRWVVPITLAFCLVSAGLNVQLYFTSYLGRDGKIWHAEHEELRSSLLQAALLQSVRNAAMTGERAVVCSDGARFSEHNVGDLPNVKVASTGYEIKEYLLTYLNEPISVVIYGLTTAMDTRTEQLQEFLAPLIPRDAWKPGPRDANGEPLVYVARRIGGELR